MLIGCGGSCFYNEFDFFFFKVASEWRTGKKQKNKNQKKKKTSPAN